MKKYNFKRSQKCEVTLDSNSITIKHRGFVSFCNKGLVGAKTIPLSNITGIQFKESGMMAGYIQFVVLGSQESKGGIIGAVKDENTISFVGKKEQEMALEIKRFIENENNKPANNTNNTTVSFSVADELLKLKSLLDSGAITQDEFDGMKKDLLNK